MADSSDTKWAITGRRCITAAAAAVIIMSAISAEGRVFSRWKTARNIARAVAGLGGRIAYEAMININGAPGHITVYGMPEKTASWLPKMKSVSITENNTITTLLGLQLSTKPLLFEFKRKKRDHPPLTHQLKGITPFPGSSPAFYAKDENTGMAVSVSRAASAPAEVHSFYRSTMKSEGWHSPAASVLKRDTGMSIYLKDKEVACVSAELIQNTGETRITLLHKKLGIK